MTNIVPCNPELGISHADAGSVNFVAAQHVQLTARSDGVSTRDPMMIGGAVRVNPAESDFSEACGATIGKGTFRNQQNDTGQGDRGVVAGSGQGGPEDGAGYDVNVIFMIGTSEHSCVDAFPDFSGETGSGVLAGVRRLRLVRLMKTA